MNEGLLSVKNASGRQVSLLNTSDEPQSVIRVPTSPTSEDWPESQQLKRKYHCAEPGCNKSFTTSGHLARHNRIHTGEKNFPCLFPGCQSRFSRQDNMMQHYRTHMSPKSRRSQKRGLVDEARPRPRLHAHHRIKSDPVQIEPPLTIDQHLSNYHQSLRTTPLSNHHSRFNFPVPLSSIARTPSNLKRLNSNNHNITTTTTMPTPISQTIETCSPSPTLSHSSSTSLRSIQHIRDESSITSSSSRPTSPDNNNNEPSPSTSTSSSTTLFYQHRPLTFSRPQNSGFPYTLLHPAQGGVEDNNQVTPNQSTGNSSTTTTTTTTTNQQDPKDDPMDEDESPSTGGLHQLAHIVSTFG